MAHIPKYHDEAAFPQPRLNKLQESERDDVLLPAQWGLTKREYFAAMAMQGILANRLYDPPRRKKLGVMAEDAVSAADALLAQLAKPVAAKPEHEDDMRF